MLRFRTHPMLATAIIAAVVTAGVISMELILLQRGGGPASHWGARGIFISAPIRFVIYFVASLLMQGLGREKPLLSQQALGWALFALSTVLWVPVDLLWTAATGAVP
jgi:O-antigen/teichoic acid export membrane protein